MALTLKLIEALAAPLELEGVTPDRLAAWSHRQIEDLAVWHGNQRARLGELFAVTGEGGEELRVEGDLRRARFLGAGMAAGRLLISGAVGAHVGARMSGGELIVDGDAGDWAGAEMSGGLLVVRGGAGRWLGGAYPGQRAGMRGGEIVVHGDVGEGAGARMRRGVIGIGGRSGEHTGLGMLAGTVVALGGVGARPGAGMRRGSIVSMSPVRPLPTFSFSCTYRPPFLGLLLRRLRALGLSVTDAQLRGSYARWCGDGLELRRADLLILEDRP